MTVPTITVTLQHQVDPAEDLMWWSPRPSCYDAVVADEDDVWHAAVVMQGNHTWGGSCLALPLCAVGQGLRQRPLWLARSRVQGEPTCVACLASGAAPIQTIEIKFTVTI